VLLVLDVQVLERGDEGLGLEAPGGPRGDGRVADGALRADGGHVAPQRRAQVTRLVPGLSHAAHLEAAAEVDAVQHHVVDAGVRRGVRDRLEGGAGAAGVGGRCHLPGEVDLALVDAGLLAALLHHGVLGVVGVAGRDAHQGVARRGRLLAALLGHLLHVVVVGEGDHLGGGNGTLLLLRYFF